jgi:hypothetical protein
MTRETNFDRKISFSVAASDEDVGLDVVALVLGLVDLDCVGHDLFVLAEGLFGVLHDLDLHTEDTLSEFDVSASDVDELELGLTGGDDVTMLVLLGLCSLASDLTGDNDLAALGATASHY